MLFEIMYKQITFCRAIFLRIYPNTQNTPYK